MQRVQVLVSGAGPAGVVAAYRLAQSGIDVLLLESFADCPEDLRASTFHPPTLDMMETLGFLDTLEAQGLKAPVYQYRNRRSGEVLSFDLSEIAGIWRLRRRRRLSSVRNIRNPPPPAPINFPPSAPFFIARS